MRRRAALALLLLAVILGATLRAYRLGDADLSADEAAAWAAAAARSAGGVIERQRALDPGKLALYDLALHGWIALGGDGAGSMRALSVVLGTAAIALVFVATRALMVSLGTAAAAARAPLAGAAAALIAGVNLTLIDQARTVRMYPLTLALELAQVSCLLYAVSPRSRGRARAASLAVTAALSALAVAANFTAGLLLAAEAAWIAWAALRRRRSGRKSAPGGEPRLLPAALALCAGLALLAPLGPATSRASLAIVHAGVLDWARLRPAWWPLVMLRRASGKAPFLLLLPLAIYGGWRMARESGGAALAFLLWWMLAPIALVVAISYTFTPLEETRYVIASAAAFLILAGIGIAAIRSAALQAGLLVLLVVLSLDHVRRDFGKPEFVQWRRAAALASRIAPAGAIAVSPSYAVNVMRYYLPPDRRADVLAAGGGCESRARVLVVSGFDLLTAGQFGKLTDCYPRLVAQLRLVEVRAR